MRHRGIGCKWALAVAAVTIACSPAWAQIEVGPPVETGAVPAELIRKKIAERVEKLIAAQHEDGSWELNQAQISGYQVGTTGLCVLALEHCYPHLETELSGRARQSIEKGIGYINSTSYECRTYSAAMAICALYLHDPKGHNQKIFTYADMLCRSQSPGGHYVGMWHYVLEQPSNLPSHGGVTGKLQQEWGDNSNTQMAVLGLYEAYRAGIVIPPAVLRNIRLHYQATQNKDGGWGYKDDVMPLSYESMSVAGVITLNLADELLYAPTAAACEPMPKDESVEKGFKWLDENLNYKSIDAYGLYVIERLGILMGQRELHGKDWFNIGSRLLLGNAEWPVRLVEDKNSVAGTSFGLLFLARGLEPIIMYKLKRKGNDWDNSHYAVKHLTEYISDHFQKPRQWRIVDLEASQEVLNSVPIIQINGRRALNFTAGEKEKLANYLKAGGTIIGVPCISGAEFEGSFKELAKSLAPGEALQPLGAEHIVFHSPREVTRKVVVEAVTMGEGTDRRCAIFLLPQGTCSCWQKWGTADQWAFDLGADIFFYVDKHWKNKQTPTAEKAQ